jgi:hypothetical protein
MFFVPLVMAPDVAQGKLTIAIAAVRGAFVSRVRGDVVYDGNAPGCALGKFNSPKIRCRQFV